MQDQLLCSLARNLMKLLGLNSCKYTSIVILIVHYCWVYKKLKVYILVRLFL